ncbi:MAG TPA: prepilin-type N-terminal cleavage/methylation domain-containing protein [Bacilli bacterium]|nr:prepilin-type N-terminal cleavage/methylation domain-containing protein [Bacilli bacterium]
MKKVNKKKLKNKEKRGFTLIELLAVILILAIIALIAIPVVKNVLDTAKKNALKDSAYGLVQAADFYFGRKFDGMEYDLEFVCKDSECKIDDKGLEFSGQIKSGRVKLYTDGKVAVCIEDGKYAAYKEINSDIVTVMEGVCDFDLYKAGEPKVILNEVAKPGDYISMTPTLTSAVIPSSYTGYSDQTIIPNELDVWRVLEVKNDGTIEVVADHTSPNCKLRFVGSTGFMKSVGTLNLAASKFTNENYVVATRHMGYDGQILNLSSLSKTSNTVNNNNQAVGGGDILHLHDYNLVKSALGTLVVNNINYTGGDYYWLASRYYTNHSSDVYCYFVRGITGTGADDFDRNEYCYNGGWITNTDTMALRPILTLKLGIKVKNVKGEKETPFVLE